MVTLAVVFIFFIMAVPSFAALKQRAAIRGAADQTLDFWNAARFEAVKRNQLVKVGVTTGPDGAFCLGAATTTDEADSTPCDCMSAAPAANGARPVIDTSPTSSYVYQSGSLVAGFTLPNPISVTPNPVAFGVPVTMVMKGYNYALTTLAESPTINCTGPSGNKTLTSTTTGTNFLAGKQTVCKNYVISSVNVNGNAVAGPFPAQSVGSPGSPNGSLSESTTIYLPAISANDVVNLTTGTEADFLPTDTCTYVAGDLSGSGNYKNNANPTVLPGSCPP